MQTIIYGRKLDESFSSVLFFLSFFCKKCPRSGCQSLRISPQHGICILDAMAMLLLWDQFIWRSGSCRCHWVLLSTTKASVKLQSVKAHALFILLTEKEIFNRDRKTSVKCQTNWGYLSCCGSLHSLTHLPSSSDRSVRTAEPERTLLVYSIHQMNTMRCQSRSKYDIYSLSPPASAPLLILLHFRASALHSAAPAWRMSLQLWRGDLYRSGNATYLLSSR